MILRQPNEPHGGGLPRPADDEPRARERLSSLRALLETARAVRSDADLRAALELVAETVAVTLGFRTVAVNLYRAAWDDFEVTTVRGNELARAALLGDARSIETWTPLLDDRFLRAGCYLIRHEEFDWNTSEGATYVPELEPDDHPDAWHPEDGLFAPMRTAAGELLGILSVDEPVSGRRPTDAELELLATLGEHAALAVESAQEALEAEAHRRGLEQLLHVSSQLTHSLGVADIATSVCAGIREALHFDRVLLQLVDATGESLRVAGSAGWDGDDVVPSPAVPVALVRSLLEPRFERAGCFLLSADEGRQRVPAEQVLYSSTANGRGPQAWNHHWLVVPLRAADDELIGVIWADEPCDMLVPSERRLQALRVFANQATTAFAVCRQVERLEFLADHDPLTGLANRRSFVRELEREVARASRYERRLALVVFDLDGFKQVNDALGHTAGDEALVLLAETVRRVIRRGDRAFRLGGDEFALILDTAEAADARYVAERVSEALAESADRRLRSLRASFGAALFRPGCSPDLLFHLADQAMYDAKRTRQGLAFAA
jgi:diguanylate cyclase (GGDEF)-like protein